MLFYWEQAAWLIAGVFALAWRRWGERAPEVGRPDAALLILLLALLVGTGLSLGLTYDLGYIRISLGNYLIETNFWVGLGLILVIILLTVTLINTVRRFRQGTGVMAGWIARGNERRARRRTTRGLLALAEGNWPRARKLLSSSASHADTPLINYLAAAQAAFESGDYEAVDELLRKAFERALRGL